MLRTLSISLLTAALAATGAPSAHAVHVNNVAGVESCGATYLVDGVRRTCTFVATPRPYLLEITSHAANYAWAQVSCPVLGPVLPVRVATSGAGTYDSKLVYLGGGVCVLEVAATGGAATGEVS